MAKALLGFLGITVAGMAIVKGSFFWFCMGLVMAAGANSFVQQYRFTASDYVQDTIKSQAISQVLIGGIAAGIIGPQLVTYNKDLLYPNPFSGACLSGSALSVIGFLVLMLLPPQIPEARKNHRKEGRIRREFVQDQTFVTAVLCGTSSYALMAFVMTAAPLAIVGCGFGVAEAAVGIQWHVLAMFVPSLFTGKLICRYGKLSIIAAGLVLSMLCSIVALSGISIEHFHVGLILLGLGWNFGFIGSTALLAETYETHEKHIAQGLNDTTLFTTVATGSLGSEIA